MTARRNRKPALPSARADLVPAVQRVPIVGHTGATIRPAIATQGTWDDPDDPNNTGQKKGRQVVGYRRADPLLNLHARGDDVTADHLRAASRFRDDYEISEGARPGFERSESGSANPMCWQEVQFRASDNYRAAFQAVGIKLSAILVVVVLEGRAPTSFAEEKGVSAIKLVGYLTAALDRLVEHYESPRPRPAA